jgi:hypothetical protein
MIGVTNDAISRRSRNTYAVEYARSKLSAGRAKNWNGCHAESLPGARQLRLEQRLSGNLLLQANHGEQVADRETSFWSAS